MFWSPTLQLVCPPGDTIGYRIYYSGGSNVSDDVSGGSAESYLLNGLQNGGSYNISIVVTSVHLYSDRVNFQHSVLLGES